MATHLKHTEINEAYFCTITCYNWLPLFDEALAYDDVYKWFSHLKNDQCHILAYVIMPNHLHCILFPTDSKKPLNKLVSEGKRFMAYSIIKKLNGSNKEELLLVLKNGVQNNELRKGKIHQVFRLSFDARECSTEEMLEQKIDYIHGNPVSGKWNLVDDFTNYSYSSAAYYELGRADQYVTHCKEVTAIK